MDERELLMRVMEGGSLRQDEARAVMERLLDGLLEPAWVAGLLVALRIKRESPEEIAGFAEAMRAHATPVPCRSRPLVDTCGTGGDGSGSFNVSTTAAFVVAGAGAHVAKHGNRSVSSRCGSADVLEALGAELELTPEAVAGCVDELGFGFLFAPRLHGAMRHAVAPRKALAVRTVFNILGPLTNPADAPHQVIGVFDAELLELVGRTLQHLGKGRCLVVRGRDGLDELSVSAPSDLLRVEDGLHRETVDPAALGLGPHPAEALAGGDATRNAELLRGVLAGGGGAPRDVVLLNAGAALWACGLAEDLEAGIERAARSIDGGRAREVLEAYVARTREEAGA